MKIQALWNKRLQEFHHDIIRYFSLIAMSVFYSFIIFGSVFAYYYVKFLQWLPASFPTELLTTLLITLVFAQTSIRTFVKQADIIFLMPAEAQLTSYFKKSMIYSAGLDTSKLLLMLVIVTPLMKPTLFSFVILAGLLTLNIRLVWIEQWLTTSWQMIIHRFIRLSSIGIILYFIAIGNWIISGSLLVIQLILWFYVYNSRTRGVNWGFLIKQEEKSLEKIYKFIHFYTDVPHLKQSFKPRRLLGWAIKKGLVHQQSSTYTYLFSHLFVRYNEFFYLALRLTLIGYVVTYFVPAYGWLIIFPVHFFTGYQVLPLQHALNDSSRMYPVSARIRKNSFKKLLMALLFLQLLVLSSASFIHLHPLTVLAIMSIELLFICWFVYVFAAKRMAN